MERVLGIGVLMLALACGASAAKLGLPEFVVPDCLGVNIHFVGREDKQVEQIAKAGFRFIRMDFHWNSVEKQKGVYDFKAYDELVDSLKQRSIRPLFILDYGNELYDEGMAPRTDEGRKAFAAFAGAAAAHFKGQGILWEIWNEPNIFFWRPQPNAENYVQLVKATSAALKKADPKCTVLAPALAGWDFGFMETICKLGVLEDIDVVSLHAYGASKPEDAAAYYSRIREIVKRYAPKGKQLPLVSGEWGYSAIGGMTVERQGEFLVRAFLTNLMNDVRLSIWYDWHDDGPDPKENEHHFGTVYLDFKEKPAYHAMQALARELKGYTFASRITLESDQDYLALFKRGGDLRLAAWTTGEPHKIKLPVDVRKFELVSVTGERRRAEAVGGSIDLDLSGGVTYVEPQERSKRWALEAGWKVTAKAVWKNSRLAVAVVSESPGSKPRLRFSGPGLVTSQLSVSQLTGAGRVRQRPSYPYVWSGDPRPKITATLSVDELDSPLKRVVELDTSACPAIEVLPPWQGEIVVQAGGGTGGTFKGKLLVENVQGIELDAKPVEITLPPGGEVRSGFKIKKEPAGQFSLACRLTSEAGGDVVRIASKRYQIVETFADGEPGKPVARYKLELDGDAKVPAKATLEYVKCPPGGPSDVCARLDFEFDAGWRFVRVSPRPMTNIAGKPRWAKLWVKGEGVDSFLRLRLVDPEGQSFQPDYGRVNFDEWRCLTASMTGDGAGHWGGPNDGVMRYPISWDTLFLVDNVGGQKKKGTVYVGPLMIAYD